MALDLITVSGRKPQSGETKSLSEVLKLQPSQWLRQYISYLFLHFNILELHYHIHDMVILYLNMLRIVMEHWIL